MKYDAVIIGGGLAGLNLGILLQMSGKNTAIFSKGASGLSFSSGNIDLYGGPDWRSGIKKITREDHPYYKIKTDVIEESAKKFQQIYGDDLIFNNGNYFTVNPFGGINEESEIIQRSMAVEKKNYSRVAVLRIPGYGDFPYHFCKEGMENDGKFGNINIYTSRVEIPWRYFLTRSRNLSDYLTQPSVWEEIVKEISTISPSYDLIFAPTFLPADSRYSEFWTQMEKASGGRFREIPGSPPSVAGERMSHVLRQRYLENGGTLEKNAPVLGGDWQGKRLRALHVKNYLYPVEATFFALATGTFFTGGLVSRIHEISEPIFNLDVDYIPDTEKWTQERFHDFGGHAFMGFGVKTDSTFRALKDGEPMENLYVAGAILSGFHPLKEKNAGGVSIASSYYVHEKIKQQL